MSSDAPESTWLRTPLWAGSSQLRDSAGMASSERGGTGFATWRVVSLWGDDRTGCAL